MREPRQLHRVGGGELTVRWRWLEGLGFTPDSSAVYAASGWDGSVRFFSVEDGRLRARVPCLPQAVTEHPEGLVFAVRRAGAVLVEPSLGTHETLLESPDDEAVCFDSGSVSVSPAGDRVAGCRGGSEIGVVARDSVRWHALDGVANTERTIFSADGAQVHTTRAGVLRTWDVASGAELPSRELPGAGLVVALALGIDGDLVVVRTERERTWLVRVGPDEATATSVPVRGGAFRAWVAAPYAALLAANAALVVDLRTGQITARVPARSASSCAISPDGRWLAWGEHMGARVHLWSLEHGREHLPPRGHTQGVRRLRFERAGEHVLSIGADGQLGRVDVRAGTAAFDRSQEWWDVLELPDGPLVASTRLGALHTIRRETLGLDAVLSPSGGVRLFPVADGFMALGDWTEVVVDCPRAPSWLERWTLAPLDRDRAARTNTSLSWCVAVSERSGQIARIADRTIERVDPFDGDVLSSHPFEHPEAEHAPTELLFHPTSDALVVGTYGGRVGVLTEGAAVIVTGFDPGEVTAAKSLCFADDGALLCVGYGDGTIGLWSFDEARLLVRWRAHEAEVGALAVGVDGLLASGSEDTTIAIWELPMRGSTG